MISDYAGESIELADAYATLCVHAGIAAADVICMDRIGEYSRGEAHADAVDHLAQADRAAAKALGTLLTLKTKAGYSAVPVRTDDLVRARRAMDSLVAVAQG